MSLGDDWNILSDCYFRKVHLFDIPWAEEFDFEQVKVAAAPFMGHIAILCLSTTTKTGQASPQVLFITNAAGEILKTHLYQDPAVVEMVWTQHEELLLVLQVGRVNVYNLYGEFQRHFSLTATAESHGVIDCRSYTLPSGGTGLALMTQHRYQVLYVSNINPYRMDQKVVHLAEVTPSTAGSISGAMSRPPSAWTAYVDSANSGGAGVCALVARDRDVHRLEAGRCTKVSINIQADYAAIVSMCVSVNQQLLALYTDTGLLWVGSVGDLGTCHCEYQVTESERKGGVRPRQMVWCYTSAVMLVWPNTLQVVGTHDSMDFFYMDPVVLVPEVDGCRILTARSHEFFQRVPGALESMGKIGATGPAAWLYQAQLELSECSGKAYECLQAVFGAGTAGSAGGGNATAATITAASEANLQQAIKQCLLAASHAWTVDQQKALLRAARMGRGFLVRDDMAEEFTSVCHKLRLLNFLRASKPVAMPLTFRQLQSLGLPQLVDRLLARKQFPLALKVAQEMSLPPEHGVDRILAYWADRKVSLSGSGLSGPGSKSSRALTGSGISGGGNTRQFSEDIGTGVPDPDSEEVAMQLAQHIHNRLSSWGHAHVSYAEIAVRALECGRRMLAEKLLEYEPKASEQVTLWIRLKRYPKALLRAVDSGDPELILFTLNALRTVIGSDQQLLNIVRHHPTALSLLQKQLRIDPNGGSGGGTDSYEQEWRELSARWRDVDDKPTEAARSILRDAFATTELTQRESLIMTARDKYKQSMNDFMTQECDQYLRLLKLYQELEVTRNRPIFSSQLSVQAVLREVLVLGDTRLVEQAKRDFRIPDKRFWWMRLEVLAQQEQWAEIEKLAKLSRKKLPVGYEVFIEVCLKQKNITEAMKYVSKLEPDKRVRFLYKLGRVDEAIEAAFAMKSDENLAYLQWNLSSTDRQACEKVQALRKQLSS